MFLNEYAGILNGPPGLGAAGQDTASTVQNLYSSIMKRQAYQGEIDYFVNKYGTNIDNAAFNEIKAALIPMGTNQAQLEQTKAQIINMYRTTLKREPTQAEIDRWVNAWGVSIEGDEYQAFVTEANTELAKVKPLTPEIATQLMIKAATVGLTDTEANEYGGYSEISRVFETTGQNIAALLQKLDKPTAQNLAAQVAVTGVGSLSFMGQNGTQLTQTGLINMINNGIDASSLSTIVQNYTNPTAAANSASVIAQATKLAQDDAIATAANNAAYLIGQVNRTGIDAPIVNLAITQLSNEMQTASTLQSQAIQQQQVDAAAAAVKAAAAATAATVGTNVRQSTHDIVVQLFQTILDRSPTQEEITYWVNAFGSTVEPQEIAQFNQAAAVEIAAKAKALTAVTQATKLTTGATTVNLTPTQIATTGTGTLTTSTVTVGKDTTGTVTSGTTSNLTPLLFIAGAAFLLGKI